MPASQLSNDWLIIFDFYHLDHLWHTQRFWRKPAPQLSNDSLIKFRFFRLGHKWHTPRFWRKPAFQLSNNWLIKFRLYLLSQHVVHPTILADADPPTIRYMVKLNPASATEATSGTPNDFGEWQPPKFSERTVDQSPQLLTKI